ncbi:MAG TPA: DinB family protein [Thermoanaerobaculia bacterium]|nr:DinB family protein [Thermoanaerobaculia bacterium]
MELRAHFRRLFVYDDWANREVLAALKRAEVVPPKALRWLAHILAAERLWLNRLRADPSPVVVWPDLTLDLCAAEIEALVGLYRTYLDGLTGEGLAASVTYVNSQGERWTSRAEDILTHVVMHSAYHRGQIAAALRAAGATPAYTDFIHAVRVGLVE